MSRASLRSHLEQYYNEHRLPEATMQRLIQLEGPAPKRPRLRRRPLVIALAAAVLLIGLLLLGRMTIDREPVRQRIAREISLNHLKRLPVEYKGSYDQLRQRMPKLDFALVSSVRLQQAGYELVGARYCSVQGQIAAQLRLRDAGGKHHTLYQTRRIKALRSAEPPITISGVRVTLFQEAGLLFGLASDLGQIK